MKIIWHLDEKGPRGLVVPVTIALDDLKQVLHGFFMTASRRVEVTKVIARFLEKRTA